MLFIEIYVEGRADYLSMSGDIGDHRHFAAFDYGHDSFAPLAPQHHDDGQTLSGSDVLYLEKDDRGRMCAANQLLIDICVHCFRFHRGYVVHAEMCRRSRSAFGTGSSAGLGWSEVGSGHHLSLAPVFVRLMSNCVARVIQWHSL